MVVDVEHAVSVVVRIRAPVVILETILVLGRLRALVAFADSVAIGVRPRRRLGQLGHVLGVAVETVVRGVEIRTIVAPVTPTITIAIELVGVGGVGAVVAQVTRPVMVPIQLAKVLHLEAVVGLVDDVVTVLVARAVVREGRGRGRGRGGRGAGRRRVVEVDVDLCAHAVAELDRRQLLGRAIAITPAELSAHLDLGGRIELLELLQGHGRGRGRVEERGDREDRRNEQSDDAVTHGRTPMPTQRAAENGAKTNGAPRPACRRARNCPRNRRSNQQKLS